jgi:hypothetical protein
MATLHSLMAVYGALDRKVVNSSDPLTAATVERYLPGTTGSNSGWFEHIENFVQNLPGQYRPFPDIHDALATVASEKRVTVPQLSRLVYGIGAALNVPGLINSARMRPIDDALMLAMPEGVDGEQSRQLRNLLAEAFTDRDAWKGVAAAAAQLNLLRGDVASVPLCDTRVVPIGNLVCVEIDTYYEDPNLTIDEVKAVLDPLNWPLLTRFFCAMAPIRPGRFDGWSRLVETVGLSCGEDDPPRITTALKAFKSEAKGGGEVRVDYDLDESASGFGDGIIQRDRGFLNVQKLGDAGGVRAVTKKVLYMQGLPSVALKQFACISGYGSISMEMIFGGAQNRPKGAVDWNVSRPPPLVPPATPVRSLQGSAQNPGENAVATGLRMSSEFITDMSKTVAQVSEKASAGTLRFEDMATATAEIGARMATDPLRFWAAVLQMPLGNAQQPQGGTQ